MSLSGLSPEVTALKNEGNGHFRLAEYLKAAAAYTKALKHAERDGSEEKELAPIYSNRSASFLKLSKVSQALQDAEKCVELRPDWDKAHFRKAAALEANDNDDEALIEFEAALGLAAADQVSMLEQKIRLCKQRQARSKREEHHAPNKKQAHKADRTVGAGEGKIRREVGSGFKFAGAAVQASNAMKTMTAAAAGAKAAAASEASTEAEKKEDPAEAEAKAKAEAEAAAAAEAKAKAEAEAKAKEAAAAAAAAAAEKKRADEKAAALAAEGKAKAEAAAKEKAEAEAAKAKAEAAAAKEKALAEAAAKKQADAAAAKAAKAEEEALKRAKAKKAAAAKQAKLEQEAAEKEAADKAAKAKAAKTNKTKLLSASSPRNKKKNTFTADFPSWAPAAAIAAVAGVGLIALVKMLTPSKSRRRA